MEVSALILLKDGENLEASVDAIHSRLPAGIDRTLFMLPEEENTGAIYRYPVTYRADESPLLKVFLDVLNQLDSGRLLVLNGEDASISRENIETLLEYSSRLPHMTVVSANLGSPLDLPIVLPAVVKLDITEFIQGRGGPHTVNGWLAQGVYMECELALEVKA